MEIERERNRIRHGGFKGVEKIHAKILVFDKKPIARIKSISIFPRIA